MTKLEEDKLFELLDSFFIELPSWGFADTGTRFGKYNQDEAAVTIEEKLQDAALVNTLTGACPTVATHVLWDFTDDKDPRQIAEYAQSLGIKIGSINPNLFQDQSYKYGSFAAPHLQTQEAAVAHCKKSIELAKLVDSKVLSLWFADGTNYPGQDNLRQRKHRMEYALETVHNAMPQDMTLLVEYKPFEPAFYHTDIADWGMAYAFAKKAGPRAKVLVDTGHHLPGTNIEHIVSFLLDENMLGGFHFNDRKYADDDLTLGSIDPYMIFRIFNAIEQHNFDTGQATPIEYMVDQSHNLKPKIEAMIQTVETAQLLRLKAALVDREQLQHAQMNCDVIVAERCLTDAFATDTRPILERWRENKDLPIDPLLALRESGQMPQRADERAGRDTTDGGYA